MRHPLAGVALLLDTRVAVSPPFFALLHSRSSHWHESAAVPRFCGDFFDTLHRSGRITGDTGTGAMGQAKRRDAGPEDARPDPKPGGSLRPRAERAAGKAPGVGAALKVFGTRLARSGEASAGAVEARKAGIKGLGPKDTGARSLGTALTLAARFHRARSASHLAALDLHPGQDRALQAMAREGAMTMGALALALQIRPPTASKMIARLSQQGLVERRAGDGDARLVEVALTPAGLERAAALEGLARTVDEEMTRGLDAKERKRFRKLLRRVTKNLAKAGGVAVTPGEEDDDEMG